MHCDADAAEARPRFAILPSTLPRPRPCFDFDTKRKRTTMSVQPLRRNTNRPSAKWASLVLSRHRLCPSLAQGIHSEVVRYNHPDNNSNRDRETVGVVPKLCGFKSTVWVYLDNRCQKPIHYNECIGWMNNQKRISIVGQEWIRGWQC